MVSIFPVIGRQEMIMVCEFLLTVVVCPSACFLVCLSVCPSVDSFLPVCSELKISSNLTTCWFADRKWFIQAVFFAIALSILLISPLMMSALIHFTCLALSSSCSSMAFCLFCFLLVPCNVLFRRCVQDEILPFFSFGSHS